MAPAKNKYLVIGLMLFALFFGAANLTFPAYLGIYSGTNLVLAILGFCLSGVTLPLLGVVAIAYSGGEDGSQLIASRVSKWYALAFMILLHLSIGPFFAIPRTGAVSYSVGIQPIFGDNLINKIIYAIIFFGLTYFLAVKPSKIADYIGKYLTPALLLVIAVLVIGSYINPAGQPTAAYNSGTDISSSFSDVPFIAGLIQGYGTMDALAALIFAVIVIDSAKEFGANSRQEIASISLKSGLVAAACLAIIYVFVARIGATSQGFFTMNKGQFIYNGNPIDGGTVLSVASKAYFGNLGQIALSLAIFLACLSTSVGLVTACANYFNKIFSRFSITTWTAILTLVSAVFYFGGLNEIIKWSLPVMFLLYPLTIAISLLSILSSLFNHDKGVYQFTIAFTAIPALYDCLSTFSGQLGITFIPESISHFFTQVVPLGQYSMGWICFSLIGFAIGFTISKLKA